MPLLQSPEAEPLAGFGTESHVDRRSTFTLGALQGVNPKTVQWTVFGEVIPHGVGKCREATKGTARSALCKRERPLELPVYFFRDYRKISVTKKAGKISPCLFMYGHQVYKGTPSLAGRSLLSNSTLDCWKIHPLRSA